MPGPEGGRSELRWEIRALTRPDDLRACEEIQREVWGVDDLEVVPVTQLAAAAHAGGLVAGAVTGEGIVGFAYAFPADRPSDPRGRSGLHSHMLAVRPSARALGLGRQLKWYQRAWCLDRSLRWITWTFDPLRFENARLNMEHLGATCSTYVPELYGPLGGRLNEGIPSDRLIALWDLDSPDVRALAEGGTRSLPPEADATALAGSESGPGEPRTGLEAPVLYVALPRSLSVLLVHDRPQAERWSAAMRAVMTDALARDYRVERVVEDGYLLVRHR